jgi:nucleoside-diphosphate-sugar epimerase
MKSVFITGWAGFVGRHLTRFFQEMEWEVSGVDVEDVYGRDMRSELDWAIHPQYVRKFDLVIHCAYHVGGRAAINGVNTNAARNLELDGRFFDWVVRTGQKNVIYYSSSATYPVRLQNYSFASTLMESDIDLDPHALHVDTPDAAYGWAKLTAERFLVPMARAHGVNVNVLRPFSGYGEDQDLVYPFPAIVKRAWEHTNGEPFTVWGPAKQARDWIHISDIVRASYLIATDATNETVNLCTGVKTQFGDLAQLCLNAAGKTGTITFDESQPTGVLVRIGDPMHMLDWYEPKISIEKGVERAFQRLRG